MVVLFVILVYLTLGLLALCLLNGKTKRIEKGIAEASEKMQEIAVRGTGTYISPRGATVITLLCLWIFWPSAVYGRLRATIGRLNAEK